MLLGAVFVSNGISLSGFILGYTPTKYTWITDKSDPVHFMQRIDNMFATADMIKKPDPGSLRSLQAEPQSQHVPVKKDKTVAEQNEADWIQVMERIRIHKDEAAFKTLFLYFAPRVKAFLMKSGASNTLAEECAQDVMATLWQKAHLFDPSRASLATWIFTIARNRKIDALRKDRRPEPEDLPWGPEAEPDQADVLEMQQAAERLGNAVKQLPEKQRRLIERAYYGDVTHSQLAAETGLPLGTIKSRIRLALKRLRQDMK